MKLPPKTSRDLYLNKFVKGSSFPLLIFTLSLIIRVIGLKFSSPLITYWNELNILDPVYAMTKNRTLNPDNFRRPDHILYLINLVYLNIISLLKTGHSFAYAYQTNPYDYFVYSRVLIAIMGTLIPVVAYKIGKESKIDFSIPAALLFSCFPVYILYSHYIGPDIPITLFTLIVILFSIRYIRTGQKKFLTLATIFASINTAEKYPGLLSFGIILVAIFLVEISKNKQQPESFLKRFSLQSLKFLGLFILGIFIAAPNLFTHLSKVIEALSIESRSTHLGADGLGWFGNTIFYIKIFANYANIITILLMAAGLVFFIKEKDRELLPIFYGLAYWIILSKLALHWERWALPMYTFPLLLAAYGFGYLQERTRKVFKIASRVLLGLSLVWSFLYAISISINMTYTDTRLVAFRFCEETGINEKNSLSEGYTPFIPGGPDTISLSEIDYRTEYIILSSFMSDRFNDEPERYEEELQQYKEIKRKFPLIQSFSPTSPASTTRWLAWADDLWYFAQSKLGQNPPERFTGPTISIYQID